MIVGTPGAPRKRVHRVPKEKESEYDAAEFAECGAECGEPLVRKDLKVRGNDAAGLARWFHLNCYIAYLKRMKGETP